MSKNWPFQTFFAEPEFLSQVHQDLNLQLAKVPQSHHCQDLVIPEPVMSIPNVEVELLNPGLSQSQINHLIQSNLSKVKGEDDTYSCISPFL